jgi:hypothetical protein
MTPAVSWLTRNRFYPLPPPGQTKVVRSINEVNQLQESESRAPILKDEERFKR